MLSLFSPLSLCSIVPSLLLSSHRLRKKEGAPGAGRLPRSALSDGRGPAGASAAADFGSDKGAYLRRSLCLCRPRRRGRRGRGKLQGRLGRFLPRARLCGKALPQARPGRPFFRGGGEGRFAAAGEAFPSGGDDSACRRRAPAPVCCCGIEERFVIFFSFFRALFRGRRPLDGRGAPPPKQQQQRHENAARRRPPRPVARPESRLRGRGALRVQGPALGCVEGDARGGGADPAERRKRRRRRSARCRRAAATSAAASAAAADDDKGRAAAPSASASASASANSSSLRIS